MSSRINLQKDNIKCVVVGDGKVGKTFLLVSYTKKCFPTESISTIFHSLSTKILVGQETYTINIWDTGGQDEVNRLRPLAYAMTDVFLIVFAVDNPASLESVRKKWAPELQHYGGDALILLIGNKSDVRDSKEAHVRLAREGKGIIEHEVAVGVAAEIGARGYCECSALTGEGVKTVFDEAIQAVINHRNGKGKGKKRKKKCNIV
mmetsp:Transcript_2135/g.3908  ORF Transcript_2135/g.3908 Transcript_2135/m.3908 type:complete len:205 (+) Transcript_2135:71-685(+)|eukprot:CAMPEP_0197519790 /NCGR_PEP_ID=MMETSP1318-20131121/5068_1 /TAXON_ID=552666 /ORGANISM="Partenskyella glossopodia, Strain RCC365" /LENGTH=204 /DNA_ID=CAMNT_0043070971 /DNA_START=47 /DNA_END=661 /DNA_ORIENTATION=+